jgi:hypothetical protein
MGSMNSLELTGEKDVDAGSMSMGGEEWQVRIDAGAESHLFGHSFGHQTRRMGDEDEMIAGAQEKRMGSGQPPAQSTRPREARKSTVRVGW